MKTLLLLLTVFTINASAQGYLFFGSQTSNQVYKVDIVSKNIKAISSNMALIRRLSTDTLNRHIYWVVGSQNKIVRADYNGANVVDILNNITNINNIKVDPVNNQIYYTRPGANTIFVCGLNGSNPRALINQAFGVQGLAIDVMQNTIYWTEYGNGNIKKAHLNGTSQSTIYSSNDLVFDLDFNPSNNLLYFSNRTGNVIQTIDTNGTGLQTIVNAGSGLGSIKLDLKSNQLFWVNNGTTRNQISYANTDGSNIQVMIDTSNFIISGIAIGNFQTSVGVSGNDEIPGLSPSVYPIPFSQQLMVDFNQNLATLASIKLYDLAGREVYSELRILNNQFTIDRGDLLSGTYVLTIRAPQSGKILLSKKVIVN